MTKIKYVLRDYEINYAPPPFASCYTCNGEGKVERNEIWLCFSVCGDCAGTGLNPLPITEVIRDLRRGVVSHGQSMAWDGR